MRMTISSPTCTTSVRCAAISGASTSEIRSICVLRTGGTGAGISGMPAFSTTTGMVGTRARICCAERSTSDCRVMLEKAQRPISSRSSSSAMAQGATMLSGGRCGAAIVCQAAERLRS